MPINRHLRHGFTTEQPPTSTGEVDVTIESAPDPLAILSFSSGCSALDTEEDGFAPSVGVIAFDGSANVTQANVGASMRDENSPTRTYAQAIIDGAVNQLDPQDNGNLLSRGNYSERTSRGVTLNYTVVDADQRLYTMLMMLKGIAETKVVETTMPAAVSSTEAVVFGFKPDFVIHMGVGNNNNNLRNSCNFSFSVAKKDPDVNNSSIKELGMAIRDQFAKNGGNAAAEWRPDESISHYVYDSTEINAFYTGLYGSNGVSIAKSEGTVEALVYSIGVKLNSNYEVDIGEFDTPTETGRHVLARTGFPTQLAILFSNGMPAGTENVDDIGMSIGAVTNLGSQFCTSGRSKSGAVPSAAKSYHSESEILRVRRGVGQQQCIASCSGIMSDGGLDMNFSVANESVRVGYIAIGYRNALSNTRKPVKKKSVSTKQITDLLSQGDQRKPDYEIRGRKFFQPDNKK